MLRLLYNSRVYMMSGETEVLVNLVVRVVQVGSWTGVEGSGTGDWSCSSCGGWSQRKVTRAGLSNQSPLINWSGWLDCSWRYGAPVAPSPPGDYTETQQGHQQYTTSGTNQGPGHPGRATLLLQLLLLLLLGTLYRLFYIQRPPVLYPGVSDHKEDEFLPLPRAGGWLEGEGSPRPLKEDVLPGPGVLPHQNVVGVPLASIGVPGHGAPGHPQPPDLRRCFWRETGGQAAKAAGVEVTGKLALRLVQRTQTTTFEIIVVIVQALAEKITLGGLHPVLQEFLQEGGGSGGEQREKGEQENIHGVHPW